MNSKELLTSVLHTVQMGQSGIASVTDSAVRPGLKKELNQQLAQYDATEKKVRQIAKKNGWEMKDIHPGILKMSDMMAKMRLMGGERDSKIAGMLIQGNTRGMIQCMKNLRQSKQAKAEVRDLAQELLEQEKQSIENSKGYL